MTHGEMRRKVFELAGTQWGLVSLDQVRQLGVARHQRTRLVAEGSLVERSPRVFAVGGATLGTRGRVLAACMDADGVASHRTAAALHGLPGFAVGGPPEVVVVGRKSHYRSELARVHTTTNLPPEDVTAVEGVPVTSVARTLMLLAGAAPEVPFERARGAVDDAVRLQLASDRWLWWRLERLRCRGRNGVTALESILVDRAGGARTESWLEREYLRISDGAGLPRPRCQARIAARGAFLARVDFFYPDERVVIEVSGAVAHASPRQRASDARRRNGLLTEGHLVLEFTYEQVVGDPMGVVDQVRGALVARRAA